MAFIFARLSYRLTSFSTEWMQKRNFGVCLPYGFQVCPTQLIDLAKMAAILDFTHNAMAKVRSGYTRISDILENLMVHTKIKLVLLFCPK